MKQLKSQDRVLESANALEMSAASALLQDLADVEAPAALKAPVNDEALVHREFLDAEFWRRIPAFRRVAKAEFCDHRFQIRHSVQTIEQLQELIAPLVPRAFLEDVGAGLCQAPMNLRISPYLLSLIDWDNPYDDPIRIQFIPAASRRLADHPRLSFDSLNEQQDAPTPNLVHRYHDKALFLPLDVCPVYCRFCTRSYSIGPEAGHDKLAAFRASMKEWQPAFAYLASRPEIEDVVISGGDTYNLSASRLRLIGETLLGIPHIRRLRFASKGPAVMPMKILSDSAWTDTLLDLVDMGRQLGKEVALHTHFNSVNEITDITRAAMQKLFQGGMTVRNQSVLIRGVNDEADAMVRLVRQLSYMNVQPYYVYQHDMVKGVEELRTRVQTAVELERQVRGSTAGFNTPTFVTDVPGGGGKRDVHSYDYYDELTGVSVYRSPAVDPDKVYLYFDPIHLLPEAGRRRWAEPREHERIVQEAVEAAGLGALQPA